MGTLVSSTYGIDDPSCTDRDSAGRIWVLLTGELRGSSDSGATWTTYTRPTWSDAATHLAIMYIDSGDFMHVAVVITGNILVYKRGTWTGSDWSWSAQKTIETVNTGIPPGQIVAHVEGTGWRVHCLYSWYNGSTYYQAHWSRFTIDSGGSFSAVTTTSVPASTNSTELDVGMDFRHADVSKEVATQPDLYMMFTKNSSGHLSFKKYTNTGTGTWSAGTERDVDVTGGCTSFSLVWDNVNSRIYMSYVRTATLTVVRMVYRDGGDTTNTQVDAPASPGGNLETPNICCFGGSVHLVSHAMTSQDLYHVVYTGTAWGSWSLKETVTTATGNQYVAMPRSDSVIYAFYEDSASYFALISVNQTGEANLQGVGFVDATPTVGIIGQAALQGVGSLSPLPTLALAGSGTLQGVGTLVPTALYVPKKDFTVYDGYVDSPASGTIPFIYFEDDSARAQTTSVPLRPPRTDTGQEPTEVRPESGEVFSQQDFSHGAGQLYFHHEGRDVRRFLWSEGFEMRIDTVGQPTLLHHLNDIPTAAVSSATIGKIEVFNDSPFVIDGANIKKGSGDFPGYWLNEDPGGTPQDMVSSGEHLYAALGSAGIARRDVTGAWSIWQATPLATRIAWVKNRIMASDGAVIYEITDSVRTVETLPAGWVFEAIFEAGGFIYAVANNASSGLSRISTYGLNSSGDALEKKNETPFPRNQLMYSGRGFLGSVYIGGGIKNSDQGFDPVVYQAFPQDSGALTYLKVNEGEGAGAIDLSVKAFEPIGEDIVFGWSLGSGFDFGPRDGLAIHKPKVDAFLGYLKKTGAGAGRQVLGIALYRGRLLFTLKGDGLYYEDTTHFVSQAQLWTSVADWQTSAKKSWDTIQISHNRLPADTTVRAEYSTRLPSEGAWNPGVLSDADGSEVAEASFTDITSQMISLRLTSTANAAKTECPSGLGFLVRSNVMPDNPEFGLVRYVRLVNKDRKDSDAPMIFTDVAAVRRKLHNLAYQWVTLYEPGVIWTLHVDAVAEVQPFLVEYDATLGEGQAQGYVVQLTMTGTRD